MGYSKVGEGYIDICRERERYDFALAGAKGGGPSPDNPNPRTGPASRAGNGGGRKVHHPIE